MEKLRRQARGLRPPVLSELTGRLTPDDIAKASVSRALLAKCVVKKKFTVQCPECWGIGWFCDAAGEPTVACAECGGAGRITVVIQEAPRAPFSRGDKVGMWLAAAILLAAAVWISLR